jgi:hypothetical protein
MRMYLTICDVYYNISKSGEEYGFSSTVFCTPELFWGEDVFNKAVEITENEAIESISEQIIRMNPLAAKEKITKFITGGF